MALVVALSVVTVIVFAQIPRLTRARCRQRPSCCGAVAVVLELLSRPREPTSGVLPRQLSSEPSCIFRILRLVIATTKILSLTCAKLFSAHSEGGIKNRGETGHESHL